MENIFLGQYKLDNNFFKELWEDCSHDIMTKKVRELKNENKDSTLDLFFVSGNTIRSNPFYFDTQEVCSHCPSILGPFTSFIEAYIGAIRAYSVANKKDTYLVINEMGSQKKNEFSYEIINFMKDSSSYKRKEDVQGICLTSFITIKRISI